MAETIPTLYTDRAEVASILSTVGIDVRIDDDDDGTITASPGEEKHLDDAILEATDTINIYGQHFYTSAVMAQSLWIRRRAAYLAAHFLSMRRGNPGLFCERFEQIMKELELLRTNQLHIPRQPKRDDVLPAQSNLIIDRRFSRNKIRVDRETSTGDDSADQDPDYGPYGFFQ